MKSRLIALTCVMMVMVASGCGKEGVATSEEPRSVATDSSQTTGVWLPTPFTSEQIRDEWIDGFQLTMRRSTVEGEKTERWRNKFIDGLTDVLYKPFRRGDLLDKVDGLVGPP